MTIENIFGIHATRALLRAAPERIREILLQAGRDDARVAELRSMAETAGISLREASRQEIQQLAAGVHQGVVARIDPAPLRKEAFLADLLAAQTGVGSLLVLDGVTDPHNLGACLRSAEAAGVQAVIIPRDNSVALTPVVRKVACGAAELVPVVAVTNLARCLRDLQQQGIWLVGTDGCAESSIFEVDLTGSVAIVMGAEGSGMRRLTRECCDYLAHIPMRGAVSSLNVSVATGICLFEMIRQRA